jgi:hypothetical protein
LDTTIAKVRSPEPAKKAADVLEERSSDYTMEELEDEF